MEKEYKGIIVEESLEDNRILNDLAIVGVRISKAENPADRWHLYTVKVSREGIEKLKKEIKKEWYMHFWQGREIIAVFRDRIFEFNYDDKSSWVPAVEYGKSQNILAEQLDFVIE